METFEDARSEGTADQIVTIDQIEHPGEDPPPSLPPIPVDFRLLHAHAVQATQDAVQTAIQDEIDQLRELGNRLKTEQDRLFDTIVRGIPTAVMEAASQGKRTAILLKFDGADKFAEFCYLYMLKGPHKYEHRQEMRAMGVKPLMTKLRDLLCTSGFSVHHSWQRATNENVLCVSW